MGGLGEGALAPGPGQVTGSASSSVVELEGSPTEKVRASTAWVALMARHVHIDIAAAGALVDSLSDTEIDSMLQHEWDEGVHLSSGGDEAVAQYLLVMDTLNFCFWPQPGLEYEHLARGLKESMEEDPGCLDADRLAVADGSTLRLLLRVPSLPLEAQRAALLREVGRGLLERYEGRASNLIAAAGGSAVELVGLVLDAFPGFRDYAIYEGRRVWLCKRAQIFVGDVWGAFRGQGLGRFDDIGQLTTFADYRVPVVLRQLGILKYSQHLTEQIQSRQQLQAGSGAEVELRACTIVAVEAILRGMQRRLAARAKRGPASKQLDAAAVAQAASDLEISSVLIDWWLWEQGEKERDRAPPHHRTLSTFY